METPLRWTGVRAFKCSCVVPTNHVQQEGEYSLSDSQDSVQHLIKRVRTIERAATRKFKETSRGKFSNSLILPENKRV